MKKDSFSISHSVFILLIVVFVVSIIVAMLIMSGIISRRFML